MKKHARRAARDEGRKKLPRRRPVAEAAPLAPSPTAVAAEAIRTGVLPQPRVRRRDEIPREDDAMRVGDPDDSSLDNEYVGDDLPGGDSPTPDQNGVDDIGRAYGLQEEDAGPLRSVAEILARRDRKRSELRAPRNSGH
jgi:uncharacterized protein DUF6335